MPVAFFLVIERKGVSPESRDIAFDFKSREAETRS